MCSLLLHQAMLNCSMMFSHWRFSKIIYKSTFYCDCNPVWVCILYGTFRCDNKACGEMLRWLMHLFSLSSSFPFPHKHTLVDTPACSLSNTHTHAGMLTVHVLIRPYTNTHSQAVNVAERKWRALWLYGFIWSLIFIRPSQVVTVPLLLTHTDYSITILMYGDTWLQRKRSVQRASYWKHIYI